MPLWIIGPENQNELICDWKPQGLAMNQKQQHGGLHGSDDEVAPTQIQNARNSDKEV